MRPNRMDKQALQMRLSYSASPCWTIQSHRAISKIFVDLFENTRHEPLTDAQCDQAKRVEGFEPDLRLVEARIRETFQI